MFVHCVAENHVHYRTHCWQKAQLSPRDPRDARYQLKYLPTVVRITQTDHVSAWGALSATATFYSATCIVLYTHRCTKLNYRTASMQCRARHQQTPAQPILLIDCNCDKPVSTTTSVVDDTANYFASAPSWTRTTVADGRKVSLVSRLSFKQQK